MTKALKIAAFALLGAVIIWACGGAKGAKETGQAFLDAINKGDCKGAQAYATEETNKTLQSMIEMNSCTAKNAKMEYGEVKEEGESATLNYKEDGADKVLTLKKVNGKWACEWSKGGSSPVESAVDAAADAVAGAVDSLGAAIDSASGAAHDAGHGAGH